MYRDQFGVEAICRVLNQTEGGFITSRGYRAALSRPASDRAVKDQLLGREILEVFNAHYQVDGQRKMCYQVDGQRKMWHAMRRAGRQVGRDQIARIMKNLGITGKTRGRGPVTTRPAKTVDLRPDLVKRQVKADRPNRLWVTDTTYVRISTGFAYTAFVTDVFTRKTVGWAVASTMTTTALPLQALDHAIFTARGQLDQLVHHADHGSQYVSIIYSQHLQDAGITSSTGSVGDSYDNAMAEAVNRLCKSEVIYPGGTWNTAGQV
jgi:transposase InsO family protein